MDCRDCKSECCSAYFHSKYRVVPSLRIHQVLVSFLSFIPREKEVDSEQDQPNEDIYRCISFAGVLRAMVSVKCWKI